MKKLDEVPPTQNELDNLVIEQVFQDNEALLQTVRAVFLGLPITEADKQTIRDTFADTRLRQIFRNKFLPELSRSTPIGQAQDIWLGVETDVYGNPPDTRQQAIQYKQGAITLTEQALALLETPDGLRFSPAYNPSMENELGTVLLTRNMFIRHVEKQLLNFWVIANNKKASPQEIQKRLEKQSAK